MVTEYFMTNDQRTELKTMLWTTSKHISILTGKRVPHNQEVMDYLAATCVPNLDFANLQFNERIHEIKYELSKSTNA
jgi:acyl-CoA thioester hydrolase